MNYVGYSDYESRTAGHSAKPQTVQAWKTKKTPEAQYEPQKAQLGAQTEILASLEKAQNGKIGRFDADLENALDNAMAYAPQQIPQQISQQISQRGAEITPPEEAFQFGDIVDIINPLHHLPVIGMVYRGLTDDVIGPAAQIVGGALYGGPIGAVTGTVNAVTQMQTGKDMGGHMLSFAGLKTDVDIATSKRATTTYARANLNNMPTPQNVTSFKLNS